MSRAFVKETAESAPPPERMVEAGPNLVTPEGVAAIEGHIARIESALADIARRTRQGTPAPEDTLLGETLARDLRYWVHQRSTAEIVVRAGAHEDTVSFGARVTIA